MTVSFRLPELAIFGIFDELLSTQNVNVARSARSVEWYFFCDFQKPWVIVIFNKSHNKWVYKVVD